jgi:eukaryotic-like serine/threonine-protein kinase
MSCPDVDALLEVVRGGGGLEDHFADCSECRHLIGELARSSLATPPAAGATFARGASIGRYVVLDTIGTGAMGVVYAAYDPELDRNIALKLVHDRARELDRRARMLREAQAMARLSHPNVVPVHDVGTVDGQVFIAMELVEGRTVKEWLAEQPRSRREILDVFVAAGRGLAAAHAAGVVHRDFKPANVLIGRDGRVRVADFGLARASDETISEHAGPADDEVSLTITGTLVGTPAYMAPELFRGVPAGPASDQFSFCVALYQALSGARRVERTAAAHVARVDRALPRRLRHVLARGLAVAPDERYPSLAALLDALDRRAPRTGTWAAIAAAGVAGALAIAHVAGGAPADACDDGDARIAAQWNPSTRGAIARAFAATGAAYAASAWRAVDGALDARYHAWSAAYRDACTAVQSPELLDLRMICLATRLDELGALASKLSRADGELVARASTAVAALSPTADCSDLDVLTTPLAVPAPLRASVADARHALAEARATRSTGQFAPALAAVAPIVETARTLGYRPLEAETELAQAELQVDLGDYTTAERTLHQAVLAAEAGRHDHVKVLALALLVRLSGSPLTRTLAEGTTYADTARAVLERHRDRDAEASLERGLAALHSFAGDHAAALAHARKALELLAATSTDDLPGAAALTTIAVEERALGRFADSLRDHERVLAILTERLGPDHPEVGDAISNIAVIHHLRFEYQPAIDSATRALAIVQHALGDDHPRTLVARLRLATFLMEGHRVKEAIPEYERVLAVRERRGEDLAVAEVLQNLGNTGVYTGDYAFMERHMRRALAIYEQHGRADTEEYAGMLVNLATALTHQGHWDEAQALVARALAILERKLGPEHPSISKALRFQGKLLVHEKRWREALAVHERGAAIDDKTLQPTDRSRSSHLYGIGNCELALGHPATAIAPLERALERALDSGMRQHLNEIRIALGEAVLRSGGDRARARELARTALGELGAKPALYPEQLARVRRLLADLRAADRAG